MSFDDFGFLGKQIDQISKDNYESHRATFDICYGMNKFAHEVKRQFAIDTNNGQQVVSSCLFIKILNGFQASVLLYKMGLDTEAKIITRTILEALFVLKTISENEEDVVNFINTDRKKREKLLSLILEKDKDNIFDSLKNELSKDELIELRRDNKENNITNVEVFEWADKAKLNVHYSYAYKMLSSEVHPDIRTLQKYLYMDSDDNILAIDCLPSTREIHGVLYTSCNVILIAIDCMCKIFNLNFDNEIKELEEQLLVLVSNCA